MEKFTLKVSESETLKGVKWLVDSPVGNIVIMQGMEEYGERYNDFALFLNSNSFNVYALDCHGQGENIRDNLSNASVWPKDGFKKQVHAHHEMVKEASKNGQKTYIFAHSMGSYMAQSYMQRFPGSVEKIVLCGSGSFNPAVAVGLLVAKGIVNDKNRNKKAGLLNKLMFSGFNKKVQDKRTDFDWLSYNNENVDKYIADPLCGFGPTNGFCLEFIKGMSTLYKKTNLSKIDKNQQIFIITGQEDPVTNYSKSVKALTKMYAKYGVKNVTSKIYTKARHELLFESCAKQVYKDVLDFYLK